MESLSLLQQALRCGLTVELGDGGALLLQGPKSLAPLVEEIRGRKADVVRELVGESLAGRTPCPCGWYCYFEPERTPACIALPCCVLKGPYTLEAYARECYVDDIDAQKVLIGMYSDSYRLYLAALDLGLVQSNRDGHA